MKIYPSFFLMLMLAVIFKDTGYMLSLITASLFHECGHILAFKMCRVDIKEFALKMGRLSLTCQTEPSALKKVVIAAMGPAFSFMLCGILLLFKAVGIFPSFADGCIRVSALLGRFNLIPVLPLDGGRIIEGFFEYKGIYNGRHLSLIAAASIVVIGAVLRKVTVMIPGVMLTVFNLPIRKRNKKC